MCAIDSDVNVPKFGAKMSMSISLIMAVDTLCLHNNFSIMSCHDCKNSQQPSTPLFHAMMASSAHIKVASV